MNVRPLFPIVFACALLGSAAVPARAVQPGEVALGGEIIMRIRVPANGLTLEQRADLVQDRINELLAIQDLNENDVTVLPSAYGPTIYVRGKKLLTVDKATAEGSGMKPAPLARAWARRLAAILPYVIVRMPGGPPPPHSPLDPPAAAPPAAPPETPTGATPETPVAPPATPPTAPPSNPAPDTPPAPPAQTPGS